MGDSNNNTPQRTPTRTRTTPHRGYNTTPQRISGQSRSIVIPPKAPDFVALAREQHRLEPQPARKGHNSFFAYNPEKEPIKVTLRSVAQEATWLMVYFLGLFENSSSFC